MVAKRCYDCGMRWYRVAGRPRRIRECRNPKCKSYAFKPKKVDEVQAEEAAMRHG
jgi:hypothetical protein